MQTNNHLKAKIEELNNFLKNHTQPPKDLFDSFILELRVSNLLIPASYDGDEISFKHLESDDGLEILPLYTDKNQYTGSDELEAFIFNFYLEVVRDCDFNGIIINPETDEFFVTRKMLKNVKSTEKEFGDNLDAGELKDLALTVKNDELVNFIRQDSNFNNFDGLIKVLAKSVLLNAVSSDEDLSELAEDGIISTLGVGGFNLAAKMTGEEKYGLLFTSMDAIKETCDVDAGIYYYCQVASLDKILNFILGSDLEGAIINPYLENYYIPRNVLIDLYLNHRKIVDNPKYQFGTYYAFNIK